MEELMCPSCEEYIEVDVSKFSVTCPLCGAISNIYWDESWDAESGEEWVWQYLELKGED